MKNALFIMLFALVSCQSRNHPGSGKTIDPASHNIPPQPKLHSHFSCNQTRLSNYFDLDIDYRCYSDSARDADSCLLYVKIKDKKSKAILDTIAITLRYAYSDMYTNCDSMTSFATGFHATREMVDNWMGDMVVADFNFDNREDIAIINDAGGNGGPFYSFYLQTPDRKFIPDPFLTDSVNYFPATIDNHRKRLITFVHAGACCVGQHIYHLDAQTGKWKQTSHKILGQ